MEIHLKVIGVILIALAGIHIFFPKYFQWEEDLKSLSLINRQMMKGHTFFIALAVFLIGLLSLIATTDLIQTKLGKTISLGLGFFWLMRLFFQLFFYSPKLWKGKRFETTIHIFFLVLWIYLSSVYLIITFRG
jgi:hypothetical protein